MSQASRAIYLIRDEKYLFYVQQMIALGDLDATFTCVLRVCDLQFQGFYLKNSIIKSLKGKGLAHFTLFLGFADHDSACHLTTRNVSCQLSDYAFPSHNCAVAQEHCLNSELGPEDGASTGLQATLITCTL